MSNIYDPEAKMYIILKRWIYFSLYIFENSLAWNLTEAIFNA